VLDVLIRNGRVIDGTGNPWYHADVGLQGDRIVGLGRLGSEPARRTIDADGLCVSPGFVDMHTHSDLALLAEPTWECKVMQGVTLEVLGQDGLGLAPVTEATREVLHQQLMGWNGPGPGVTRDWSTVGQYLDRFDRRVSPNVAMLVPHGTVRMAVMGLDDRAPAAGELQRMRERSPRMRDGAVGLSAGLTYTPASYATDDEVVALCEAIRPFGGYYQPHHRNYGARALEAYAASLEIGRRAGVPVHFTHALLNFPVNRGRAGELLAMIDGARAGGRGDADTYHTGACPTSTPPSRAGPRRGGRRSSSGSEPRRAGPAPPGDGGGSDGFNGMPVDGAPSSSRGGLEENRPYVGLDPGRGRAGGLGPRLLLRPVGRRRLGAGPSFRERGERAPSCSTPPTPRERRSPSASATRSRGTSPATRGVRPQAGLVRLEMVRKMTCSCVAPGFPDRGLIRAGAAADVVCFDADRVQDTATYEPRGSTRWAFLRPTTAWWMTRTHTGAQPGRARGRRLTAGPLAGCQGMRVWDGQAS
jgi:N-acyl-D-amino-acid deacylase